MSTVKINKIVGFVGCFFLKLHRPSEQLGHETIAVKFFFLKSFLFHLLWNYFYFSFMFLNMGAASILETLTTAMIERCYFVLYAIIHFKDIENTVLITEINFWGTFHMWEFQRKGNTSSYFPVIILDLVVCQRAFCFLADSAFSVLERTEWLYLSQH